VSPQDELRSIIAELDRFEDGAAATWDRYGNGGPVAALESQVAALLGKPAAVMFPSGTMAQQSALRVWSDRGVADAWPYGDCRICGTTNRTVPDCSTTSVGHC
jgi:7-keto-8-aminopelargonate synthetase-like enzyme